MFNDPSVYEAKKLLGDAPLEKRFVLKDGSVLSGLRDLYSAMKSMPDDVFYHHVTDERNDFGNWVKDVFKDYRLANGLFSTKSKNGCMSQLGNRIYELDKLVASPDRVLLLPAPASIPSPNKERMEFRKCSVEVSPAELEKSLQEITKRSLEKRTEKTHDERIRKERARAKRTREDGLKEGAAKLSMIFRDDMKDSLLLPPSVEDILEQIEKEQQRSSVMEDFRSILSASAFKGAAAELKALVPKRQRGRLKAPAVSVAKSAPDKDALISELKKAHRMGSLED
jgi:hypothetical protein